MAQTSTIPVPARSAVIDNLRLARGRVESAEWFMTNSRANDPVMVRSLAQTAIYALQAVVDDLADEITEPRPLAPVRELRRSADVDAGLIGLDL